MSQPRTLFVGIGSPHGDDRVGWNVADALRGDHLLDHLRIEKASSPIEMFDWFDDFERLILCDGCRGLGRPGEMRRLHWPTPELEQPTWSGTHDFSLIASLQLAERLGRLPAETILWAIEIVPAYEAETLSPNVASAVPVLIERIKNESFACTSNPSPRTCCNK